MPPNIDRHRTGPSAVDLIIGMGVCWAKPWWGRAVLPGSRGALLPPSPLRTGLDTFVSSGSSKLHSHRVQHLMSYFALFELCGSDLLVAKEVEQHQIVEGVSSAFIPSHNVVFFIAFVIE